MSPVIRTAAISTLFALAAAAGCASYATYPPVPGDTAINNPNTPALGNVMLAALRHVAIKYPPGGETDPAAPMPSESEPRFAFNLPAGVTPAVYERLAHLVGYGAVPLSPDTSHLPIYHITYLRIRGDQAQVSILRPVTELPLMPAGTPVMQEIKLNLRGGLRPWQVVAAREWDPGTEVELPGLNYYHPKTVPAIAESRTGDGTYRPAATAADPNAGAPE